MNDQFWSWLLGLVGVVGFILAGRKIWWAWHINIAAQLLWFTYAIATEQWGFFISAMVYTFVFTKNAYSWTKEHYSPSRRMREPIEKSVRFIHCRHHFDRTENLVEITDLKTMKTHHLCQACFVLSDIGLKTIKDGY